MNSAILFNIDSIICNTGYRAFKCIELMVMGGKHCFRTKFCKVLCHGPGNGKTIKGGDKGYHGQEILNLLNLNVAKWLHNTIHPKDVALGATMKTILSSYAKVVKEHTFTFGEKTDLYPFINSLEEGYSNLNTFQQEMKKLTKRSHFAIDYQPSLNAILYKESEEQDIFGSWSPIYHITSHAPFLKHECIKKNQIESQITKLNSELEKLDLSDQKPKQKEQKIDVLTIKSFQSYNPLDTKDIWYSPEKMSLFFKEIKQNSPEWLIIDLRENNGGPVKNSKHFLKELTGCDLEGFDITQKLFSRLVQEIPDLPQQSEDILPIHYSLMADYLSKEHPVKPELFSSSTQIIVLVDGKTYSAGECIAQALKEFNLATVIGCKTSGHVLTQSYEPIALGYLARFPIAEYISRTGVYLEGKGVTPDIELSNRADALECAKKFLAAEDISQYLLK